MVVVRTRDLGHGNPGLFYASRRNDGKESSSVVTVENRCDDRRQRTSEQRKQGELHKGLFDVFPCDASGRSRDVVAVRTRSR